MIMTTVPLSSLSELIWAWAWPGPSVKRFIPALDTGRPGGCSPAG